MARLLLALLCLCCGLSWAQGSAHTEAATGFAARPTVMADRYLAVTANRHASEAAAQMLAAGGSAVDAAIAAQMVLTLVEPQSSGIGGGGFMLHYQAEDGKITAFDGRETAPAAARPDRFLTPSGEPMGFDDAVVGGRSVGVPGLLAMLEAAHQAHGRLPWQRLFEPAICLAEAGFAVSPRLHRLLDLDRHLRLDPAARALYYDGDGAPRPVGSRLRNPELAATLRRIAGEGTTAFYRGVLAQAMVAAVSGHAGKPGDLSMADLAGYRAKVREAICGDYRGYRICGMPPPSSGGVAVLQMLGLLAAYPTPGPSPLDPLAVHRFAEAGRLAFADRGRYLADGDHVAVPVAQLLDPAYLTGRARLMDDAMSLGQALPGEIPMPQGRFDGDALELPSTSHLSIVDAQGNALSMTSSIEDAFGSRLMVRGFLLNNQLTDFAFRPHSDGRPVANRLQPGKRPLSAMSPTLVFDGTGRLYAVLGSPGGSRIINYVARALTALLDWRLPPGEVVALAHVGSRNGPTELEYDTAAADLAAALEARGHSVRIADMTSGLHLIVRDGARWLGAADPRREGAAVGE